MKMQYIKASVLLFVSLTIFFLVIFGWVVPRTNQQVVMAQSGISLEGYCQGGYYKIPTEADMVCSRAPNCGGYDYKQLNTTEKMPNPQKCMGDNGGKDRGCNGWVPLCCYEVARTGDFTKCIGYWERLWCAPSQCDEAKQNGASDSQCGGDCQCAHAFKTYCGNVPPIPLKVRLDGTLPYGAPYSQKKSPSPTPTTIIPTLMVATPTPYRPRRPRPSPTSPIPTKLTPRRPIPTLTPIPANRRFPSPVPSPLFPPTKTAPGRIKIRFKLPSINLAPLKIAFHKTMNTINKPIVKTIQIDRMIENKINRFLLKLITSFQ